LLGVEGVTMLEDAGRFVCRFAALWPLLGCFPDDVRLLQDDSEPPDGVPVSGTIQLPLSDAGSNWLVKFVVQLGFPDDPTFTTATYAAGKTTGEAWFTYRADVLEGRYRVLGLVDRDGSDACLVMHAGYAVQRDHSGPPPPPCAFADPTPGDFVGWYAGPDAGSLPPADNVIVPDRGRVTFDWSLGVAP
jgi:hypothetical protein